MSGEKYVFKGRLFGGFDRRDVMAYVEQTAAEINALKDEKSSLEEQIQKMCDDHNAALTEMNEIMNAQIEEAKVSCQREIDEVRAQCGRQIDAETEKRRAAENIKVTELEEAQKIVAELKSKYNGVKSDMDVTAAHVRGELGRVSDELSLLSAVLSSSEKQIDELECVIKKDKKSISADSGIKIGPND